MKRLCWILLVAGALGFRPDGASTARGADEAAVLKAWSDDSTLRPYWREGLRLDTLDKAVSLRIGGRLHFDTAFFDADDTLPAFENGAQFRRARLSVEGTIYDNVEFKGQYDFAGGDADFRDAYVGLKDIGGGARLRIGQFKEFFSLEELTSSNYITFMERGLPNQFAPSRNVGAGVFGETMESRVFYGAGMFYEADDYGTSTAEDSWALTARIAGLPWHADKTQFLHIGAAYSYRSIDDLLRYRQRPESGLGPRLVDTKVSVPDPGTGEMVSQDGFQADGTNLYGLEAALVYGPASVQAEYIASDVDSSRWGDPTFSGYYAFVSYFLTGESRPYRGGAFSRVRPKSNFGSEGGMGAWEVAARYSSIDLTDGGVNGGELSDITAGLNWYLNPNTRMMVNYVYADASERNEGNASIVQARFQIDF